MQRRHCCLGKMSIGCLISVALARTLAQAAPPTKILVEPGATIAFMGDSITDQGWKHPAGYVRLIVDGLAANKIQVTPIPAGVGGNIAGQMRDRLQKDVLDKKPDWLLLSCGINDVWHLAEHKQGFDQFQQNITALVDAALAAGVKVVILTTSVIGEDFGLDHNRTLVAYNKFLRDLAKEKHCLVADIDADCRQALKSNVGGQAMLTADGVHLNPHGEELFAGCVLRTFGIAPDRIEKLKESWRDIPDAWQLRANYDKGNGKMFLVQKLLTIGQFERLQRLAAAKKAVGTANGERASRGQHPGIHQAARRDRKL